MKPARNFSAAARLPDLKYTQHMVKQLGRHNLKGGGALLK